MTSLQLPNKDWLINIIHTLDENNEIFQKHEVILTDLVKVNSKSKLGIIK